MFERLTVTRLLLVWLRLSLLVLTLTALAVLPARGHGVAVDGDPGDWSGAAPPGGGYDAAAGEWVWRAAEPNAPLQEFRVTADTTYIYCLVRLADIPAARGDGAPLIQIAVDTDLKPDSGQTVFVGFSGTRLAPGVADWERLIRTSFGSGRTTLAVLDTDLNDRASNADFAILSTGTKTVEMRARWEALGVKPATRLRLALALFQADSRDNVRPEGAPAMAVVPAGSGAPARITQTVDITFRGDGSAVPPDPPMRVGRWEVVVPPLLREPLLYAALVALVLIVGGIILKLRARPKSYWWG